MKFSFKGKGGGGGKSGGGIKALLLKHGEKIGMAVVAVCVVGFLYSAMGREKLAPDMQHDVLLNKVNTSKQNIDGYTWEQALQASAEAAEGETPNVLLAQEMTGEAVAPVPFDPYKGDGKGLDRPVVPPTVLREDPVLLSVTDIEVHGWSALIPLIDEATRRQRLKEAARLEEKRRKDAEKLAAEMARDAGRGGEGRGPVGPGPGYGREMGYGAEGMIDPENPDRRMSNAMVRPEGVALQGDEKVVIEYGATILAKVPVEEQMKLYRDALENAKGGFMPDRDRPRYMGAYLQRAEVTDNGAELKWEPVMLRSGSGKKPWPAVTGRTIADAVYDWPMEMEEIADTRYVHPLLTFPLPPLVGQNWGERAKLADVPLQADFNADEEMRKQMESAEKPAEAEGEENLFGGAAPGVAPGTGYGSSERMPYGGGGGYGGGMRYGEGGGGYGGGMRYGEGGGGYGPVGRPGGGEGEMGGYGRGYGGGGYGYGGGGEMGMGGGATGVRRNFEAIEEPFAQKPFWMFRFFDMNVEPGKRYRYRVQLVLTDVNGYIPRQFLSGKVIERLPPMPEKVTNKPLPPQLRKTDWSQPSPTVSIPMAGEVRVAQTTPAADRQFNSEPTAKLLVKSFDVDEAGKAIQAAIEEEFRRGSVMNLVKDAETVVGQYIDKIDDFKFRTGATLLDIQGGEQVIGDINAPAKVLVMDAGGRLAVREELTDIAEVEQHRAIFAEPEPGQPMMGYGGEGGYGRSRGD
jgi:hypothetical protein